VSGQGSGGRGSGGASPGGSRGGKRAEFGGAQGMRSPKRRRGTAQASRQMVTPAGARSVPEPGDDAAPARTRGGKRHHPGPPRPHSDHYPALDGLGQAALNAEAEVWLRTLVCDARESLSAIAQAAQQSDSVLRAVAPAHIAVLEGLIDRWPRFAGDPPEELVAAVAQARVHCQ